MKGKQGLRKTITAAVACGLLCWGLGGTAAAVATLNPTTIPKYLDPLVIPPAMPRTTVITAQGKGKKTDYYEIAVRQFQQQILPTAGLGGGADPFPATTVWSYGNAADPTPALAPAAGSSFNYPAFTIEARSEQPVRVKWINDLVDSSGTPLPHLLPVDPALHWANPIGAMSDSMGPRDPVDTYWSHAYIDGNRYVGPVPIVTHLHGAETSQESDGYPEAWYLPAGADGVNYTTGTLYNEFRGSSPLGDTWTPGSAVFEYPNTQRATTLWYHDHTLGMTRLNVYAGPAGFYLLRGGPSDAVLDAGGKLAVLPGPAPQLGDPPGTKYYEIPIVIQDRSFNDDGSLFYPDNRAFFEGLEPADLDIPFIPDASVGGAPSDVAPIWNPEFFGDAMVVNGKTWPFLEVEQRRYRLRFLNGCNSRFLILKPDFPLTFWQIGADGGFLPGPLPLQELLLGPAERADVIVDFSAVPAGTAVTLLNLGPDEPFGGGVPGIDFDPANPATTGQVMQFKVVKRMGADKTTPPDQLALAPRAPLPAANNTRYLSLNEEESASVCVLADAETGDFILPVVEVACDAVPEAGQEIVSFGPTSALLGTVDQLLSTPVPGLWSSAITEEPRVGQTEEWVVANFTMDAHPIHVHLVQFEIVHRRIIGDNSPNYDPTAGQDIGYTYDPAAWETGTKDTVIVYPGELARIKAQFQLPGLFVWHCHILEHEDNEMMRPYCIDDASGNRPAACDVADRIMPPMTP